MLATVLHGPGDGHLAAGESTLADPGDPFVRVHDDEGVVTLARPRRHEDWLDVGDLHGVSRYTPHPPPLSRVRERGRG